MNLKPALLLLSLSLPLALAVNGCDGEESPGGPLPGTNNPPGSNNPPADGGTLAETPADSGTTPPPADSGTPVVTDAGTPGATDAGAPTMSFFVTSRGMGKGGDLRATAADTDGLAGADAFCKMLAGTVSPELGATTWRAPPP
jgi:hypothetical protein